jgi:hypothetical protein
MTEPRIEDLPADWQPGDSGFTLDDSTLEPPALDDDDDDTGDD